MKVYLIYGYGWDWHRCIAVRNNKDEAIRFAKETAEAAESVAPRGCSVHEFEVNGGEGRNFYRVRTVSKCNRSGIKQERSSLLCNG
jgi:hypothetical protein